MAQFGADLITGDVEELRAAIHAALKKLETPVAPPAPKEPEDPAPKLVYVICDERDRKATMPLRKLLKARDSNRKFRSSRATLPLFANRTRIC